MVPISVRTEEQGGFGNRVSTVVVPIGTDEPDPVRRLQAIHAAMRTAKETNAAIGADLLEAMSEFAMPALAARASRVAAPMRIADVVSWTTSRMHAAGELGRAAASARP